jgi:hypothetical protein
VSAQKILIIVLVVLVVIFVITVGIGGCHGSGRPDPNDAGFVGALKGLQGNRFLEIGEDTSTTCQVLDAQTLRVNGTCAVNFEERAFFRRSTRVVFQTNAPLRVIVNPNDGPRQDEQLPTDGKFCFGSAVNRSGGTMTLTGNNVTVVLLRQACPE